METWLELQIHTQEGQFANLTDSLMCYSADSIA
jgi:hypothetical protein